VDIPIKVNAAIDALPEARCRDPFTRPWMVFDAEVE
jgi:hypothetical protein